MATQKPYMDEPGRYCSKLTGDGWLVMIDYALRLSKGGAEMKVKTPEGHTMPNRDPWVVWHPASNAMIGFQSRARGTEGFKALVNGEDVQGMLTAIRGGAVPDTTKQVRTDEDLTEAGEMDALVPARARTLRAGAAELPKP